MSACTKIYPIIANISLIESDGEYFIQNLQQKRQKLYQHGASKMLERTKAFYKRLYGSIFMFGCTKFYESIVRHALALHLHNYIKGRRWRSVDFGRWQQFLLLATHFSQFKRGGYFLRQYRWDYWKWNKLSGLMTSDGLRSDFLNRLSVWLNQLTIDNNRFGTFLWNGIMAMKSRIQTK